MTVEEYLEHEPEEGKPDSKQISSILGTDMEVWPGIWWRLMDEQFLGWYIWLKDNFEVVREFVEEIKQAVIVNN